MLDILRRFLLLWLTILLALVVLSFALNWSLFLTICSQAFGSLLHSLAILGIMIAAIVYLLRIGLR